MMLYKSWRIF